jgi:hypothetical protein
MGKILIVALVFGVAWLMWWGLRPIWLFKTYDNPYRRHCKRCGSHQEYMTRPGDSDGWWEEWREGDDPDCPCKQYQHYKPY